MAKSRQSRSNRKQRSQKRGGAYGGSTNTLSPASFRDTLQRGGKRSVKRTKSNRKQRQSRKQKRSRKSESFISTLNQMGGFVRDGTTQFFRILKGEQ